MRARYVTTNGVRCYCLEAGPPDGPLVLLLHGFPELAYSWRHQVAALGAAGYLVVAPDLPGYGRSDKPDVAYDCEWVNATIVGIADALGRDRFVVAGHDWGGILVWIMARRYPDRVAGVVALNTPDLPRPPVPPVQLLRQVLPDTPIYIVQFQEPGLAEWVLGTWGRGTDDFVEMMFRNETVQNRDAFPDAVLDVYKQAFRPVGALTPPIEYYRNLDRNWALTADLADRPVEMPCLMISAADDPVLTPALTMGMEERVRDLTRVVIERCGHWTQQERPEETTVAMADFLDRLRPW
jgi:pimeloyl-ACP methyl ester carboxylesterase